VVKYWRNLVAVDFRVGVRLGKVVKKEKALWEKVAGLECSMKRKD